MAPWANWKGYLRLSPGSCAVALFPATTLSLRIFDIPNRQTGDGVRNGVVNGETGGPIADEDRVKGFREKNADDILIEGEFDRVRWKAPTCSTS